jgi:RNA polymerase sigma-70 factor (ECF subfamily)
MSSNINANTETDLEIVKKIAIGDEVAFSKLYSRYNLPVFNFILRLIGKKDAAEDVLQEVFIAVWQGSNRFQSKSAVKTWLFKIAYHKSISWLRKEKKLRLSLNIDELSILSDKPSPEGSMIDHWQEAQIKTAIAKLSHNHRSVIELTFVHGFSYKEIAKIMKCPIGTVKSRMNYALRYLKTDLSGISSDEF